VEILITGLFNYTLYKSIDLDPAEISCSKLLNSEFLRGGLVQITPTDPFEEDKGESRSMVASMIGTPQLATPTVEVPSGAIGAGMTIIASLSILTSCWIGCHYRLFFSQVS